MGLKENIRSIGKRLRLGAKDEPRLVHIEDERQLEQALDAIVARFPGDHRILTYSTSLSQLPPSALSDSRRVLEVGMNDNLIKFREIFGRDVEFFGITLDESHSDAAKTLAMKKKVKADVRLRDIKDGLTEGFDNMDIAIDIFSASHYADTNETIKTLANSLRSGGHIIVVPGGLMYGLGDYIGENPEDKNFVPQFRYTRGKRPSIALRIDSTRDRETALQEAISTIIKDLIENGYSLPDDLQGKDLIACFEDMATTLRVDTVTSYDLLDVNRHKVMESLGLTDIKKFATLEGDGWIGRKQ